MHRSTAHAGKVLIVVIALASAGITQPPRVNQSTPKAVQRLYQQYIEELELENAKIGAQQANFGERAIEETKDAIKSLVGLIKISNPSEEAPDPKHWVELAEKLGELVQWYTKTLNDLGDSGNEVSALEAKLGQLNQRLAESEVAVKAKVADLRALDSALRKQKLTLHPLPMPQRVDWTDLDQAIENMRKEDQPLLESERTSPTSYDAQRKALTDRWKADADAMGACVSNQNSCNVSCTGPSLACNKACNATADQCMAPLLADAKAMMDAVANLDAKHNGYPPPK